MLLRIILCLSTLFSLVISAKTLKIENLINSKLTRHSSKPLVVHTRVDKGAGLIFKRQRKSLSSARTILSIKKLKLDAPLTFSDAAGIKQILRACIPTSILRYDMNKLEKD